MDPSELERLVAELEIAVDRLRSLYDQYFMGIEKLEPSVPHKEVERRIHTLRKEQIRNTAQRFRFQMVLQRYNTLQTHWQRVCREIERGTYKRHVERAEKRFSRRSTSPPPPAEVLFDVEFPSSAGLGGLGASLELLDSDLAAEFAPPPARPPSPSAASPPRALYPAQRPPTAGPLLPPVVARSTVQPVATPRPSAETPHASVVSSPLRGPSQPSPVAASLRPRDGTHVTPSQAARPIAPPIPGALPRSQVPGTSAELSDQRLRELYTQLVDSRRKQRESTAHITFDSMARTLRESSAKLRAQHGRAIDFEVIVKDGRTVLRPLVK